MDLQWRRRLVVGGVALALALVLLYGFYPRPLMVETAAVVRAPLQVTVEQEGRTRVVDRYAIAAPVAGYARRIPFDAGSMVQAGTTLVELEPVRAPALDARSRAEALARVAGASTQAAATAQVLAAARTEAALAKQELERVRGLRSAGYASAAALDRAAADAARSAAQMRSAEFNAATAQHALAAARTALMYAAAPSSSGLLAVRSPVTGRILRIPSKSEGPVGAGQVLLEIGDPSSLEVEVDLLSADAVRVRPGTRVVLERWGGAQPLQGEVKRVEPAAFTKLSALGVEEQRVWTIVAIRSPRAVWERLGDGYRVEASFIVWDAPNVLQVPASALFRHSGQWAAYVVESGRAVRRQVRPGVTNGLQTQVLSGLAQGDLVVAHPDDRIREGLRVDGETPP
ncbi:efflux RND transporter periplasmic adaptor subunit [Pseudoduganella sp. GCM10020061]|uniref:efflux RND transporter periplasmic adaptor subunit n=1 Tax=Pseudoduganella sp. GCM10020061 TaxID=3317345 RepID=UPI003641825F